MKLFTKICLCVFLCLFFSVSVNAEDLQANVLSNDSSITSSSEQQIQTDDEQLTSYKPTEKPMGSVTDVSVVTKKNGLVDIIFKVDTPFVADVKVLNFPFRLMIDIPMPYQWAIPNAEVKKKVPITLIQGFRYGHPVKNVFRIVGDLGRSLSINRTYVTQNRDGTYNFIIEVNLNSSPRNSVVVSNSIAYTNQPEVLKELSNLTDAQAINSRNDRNASRVSAKIKNYLESVSYPKPTLTNQNAKILVMLDPGHGGKDPGATSADNSLVEKDVVLDVAKRIKSYLEENSNISVVLTRSGDYYVPLKDRVFWAEYYKADIFISIHADKSETSEVSSGLSIYTLSDIASDAQTQLLANNANKSDIVAEVTLGSEDEEVNKILVSLSQRVKVNESINLSKSIVKYVSQDVRLLQNPIRSAGFAVLKIPNIPSILLEAGFLSNTTDVNNFKNKEYLNTLAFSVSVGIQSYLWDKGMLPKIPKAVLDSYSISMQIRKKKSEEQKEQQNIKVADDIAQQIGESSAILSAPTSATNSNK
jgi:N-acetylmuramoyl-L-alanine amidase